MLRWVPYSLVVHPGLALAFLVWCLGEEGPTTPV